MKLIKVLSLYILKTHIKSRGVLPIMAYTGRLARKGYLLQASGIKKGRDFLS